MIAFTNLGYDNRGTLRVKGAEVSLLSPEHFWGQVRVIYGVLDFSNFSQAPLRRPPSYGTLSWLYNGDRWGGEVSARYQANRRDIDFQGNSVKLSAYEILSAKIRFSPTQEQDVILSLGNMTDREYEDIWGYAVAPVSFSLSWNMRF